MGFGYAQNMYNVQYHIMYFCPNSLEENSQMGRRNFNRKQEQPLFEAGASRPRVSSLQESRGCGGGHGQNQEEGQDHGQKGTRTTSIYLSITNNI